MKKVVLLLLFITVVVSPPGHSGGTQRLYFDWSSCLFAFSSNTNNTINFHNCTLTSSTFTNWQTCFIQCCGSDQFPQYPSPSQGALDYCKQVDQNKSTLQTIRFIILSLALTVVLTLCCCCVCRCCCRRNSQNGSMGVGVGVARIGLRSVVYNSQMFDLQPREVEWNDQKQVNYRIFEGITWSHNAKSNLALKQTDQPCTICLQQNTTCQLFCGHQYHPICIGDWLKKSTACPCCRRQNIKGVKVFCNTCKWRYYVCTRRMISARSRELPLKCNFCSNYENAPHNIAEDNSIEQLIAIQSNSKVGQIPRSRASRRERFD